MVEAVITESDLKRYLIRSIRAQGGVGHRFEDKYVVGWPDMLLIPENGPVFFVEAKLVKGLKIDCTSMQAMQLSRLNRDPYKGRHFCYGVLVGYSEKREALYVGQPGQSITDCRFVPRPRLKLDSSEWWITELLGKYHHDKERTKA